VGSISLLDYIIQNKIQPTLRTRHILFGVDQ